MGETVVVEEGDWRGYVDVGPGGGVAAPEAGPRGVGPWGGVGGTEKRAAPEGGLEEEGGRPMLARASYSYEWGQGAGAAGVGGAGVSPRKDTEARRWLAQHPSALAAFETVAKRAAGRRIALFLDYDGTLTPIVRNPDEAFIPPETRAVVQALAEQFPCAIISGRGREKVYDFVKVREMYYAGSHGLDIGGPKKRTDSNSLWDSVGAEEETDAVLFQPALWAVDVMNRLFRKLEEALQGIAGASVEHNKFCVTVHFRCCDPKDWDAVAETTRRVTAPESERIRLTSGRKVLEVRPDVEWDKGKALKYLLEVMGLTDRSQVLPMYIGDDATDEDAFSVLRELGDGITVLVTSKAKPTEAEFSLQDPAEVREFLKQVGEIGEGNSGRGKSSYSDVVDLP